MESTAEIQSPLVCIARDHNIRIDNDMETAYYNHLDESEVMREIETDRFIVRFTAKTERHLDLSWLLTKAFIRDGGGLVIRESQRYGQREVDEYGEEQVIEWINEDRREMAEIIRSYVGLSDDAQIFVAVVEVIHKASGAVLGSDRLGGCIYNSYEEFCQGGGYASDLVHHAVKQAREAIADLCR